MIVSLFTSIIEVFGKVFMFVVLYVVLKVILKNVVREDDGTHCDDTLPQSNLLDETTTEKSSTSKDDEGTYCDDSCLLSNLPAKNTIKKTRTSKNNRKRNCKKKGKSKKSKLTAVQSDGAMRNEIHFSEGNIDGNQKIYNEDFQSLFNPLNDVFTSKDIKHVKFGKSSKFIFDGNSAFVSKRQKYKKDCKLLSFSDLRYSCGCEGMDYRAVCKQQNRSIREIQPLKDYLNANLLDSSFISQLPSKQKDDGKLVNALLSNNIPNKKLDENYFNSTLLTKQQNEKECDNTSPTEDILDTNLVVSCSNSQLSKQQEEEKVKETSPSKDIEKLKLKKYFFNFHIVFKQQNKMKCRRVKIKENPEVIMFSIFEQSGKSLYTADIAFFSKENKECLPAHSSVFAAKSEYFQDLLFGARPKEIGVLEMNLKINVTFDIFFDIIKWFYTEKIEFTDDCTVVEIYQAAKHFKIQQLIEKCKNYIESMEITDHNVLSNLQLSITMKIEELDRICTKYIEQNALPVINSSNFLKVPFSIVKKICELRSLSLTSEVEMLEALIKWLDAQQLKLKKKDIKSLEKALLRCVRFLNFSPQEFADVVAKNSALFTPDESLSIFLYLVDPNPRDFKALPPWCSKSYRTLASNPNSTRKHVLPMDSGIEKIKIQLKDSDSEQGINELSSVLEMRCLNGIHELKSIKFSFQAIKSKECVLAHLEIKIKALQKGNIVYSNKVKNRLLKNSELTFHLPRGVMAYEGQVLQMEVTANLRQGNFLQFDKWFPKSNFDCFFVSIPIEGRLYIISEVAYGPLITS